MGNPHRVSASGHILVRAVAIGMCALSMATGASGNLERGKLPSVAVPIRSEEATRRMFGIAIDRIGRILAANGELLIYDGYTVRKLALPGDAQATAVATDSRGNIWTGGASDLGYFTAEPTGDWSFHSLKSLLPDAARDYENLWQIYCVGESVFFVTSQHLLLWRDGKFIDRFLPNQRRLFASAVQEHCYVWQREWADQAPAVGADRTISTLWVFDQKGRAVTYPKVTNKLYPMSVLAEDADGIDIMINDTRRARLRNGQLILGAKAQSETSNPAVVTANLLSGGDLLTGMDKTGLYRLGPDGAIRWRASTTSKELPDNAIEALALDRRQDAWVIAPNSIYRIATNAAITTWPASDGWPSAIHCIARIDDTLYIGNAMGQHKLVPSMDAAPAAMLPRRPKSANLAYSYLTSPTRHFVTAGINDNYIVDEPGQELSQNVSATGRSVLHLANDNHVLLYAETQGIHALQDPATLSPPAAQTPAKWPTVWDRPVRALDRAYAGTDGEVFVTTKEGVISFLNLARRDGRVVETVPARICTPETGIGRIVNAQQWGNHFYAFTRQNAWIKGSADSHFRRLNFDGYPEKIPFAITRSANGTIWVAAEIRAKWRDPSAPAIYGLFRADVGDDGSVHGLEKPPVSVIDNLGSLTAHFSEPGVWWLGGTEGLARVDLSLLDTQQFETWIDRPYFTSAKGEHDEALELQSPLDLRDARKMRVEFSFSRHLHALPVKLETRLTPLEADWTQHADDSRRRNFHDLPGGTYTLEVRAIDLAGQISPGTTWTFKVTPRFSETGWYLASVGGAGILIFLAGAYAWTWRLRRRRDELARQVAERTESLVEANQELHRLNSRRVEFIGEISHELRTPLLGATLMANQLAAQPASTAEMKRLSSCLNDLQSLLEGTMDLSRYELGLIPVRLGRTELNKELQGIIDLFEPLALAKGLVLKANNETDAQRTVVLDIPNFRRIAANLVSNAVKYTSVGEIVVGLGLRRSPDGGEAVELAVSDTGVGLAPQQLEQLFTDYHRRPLTAASEQESHGLGLALTKRLVDLAGGAITCESSLGHGAKFTVGLPTVSSTTDEAWPPFEVRALLIEDERSHIAHAHDLLEPLGVTLTTCERLSAIDSLKIPEDTALVLVDFNLPDGTGLDVLTRLKNHWARPPRWVLVSAIRSEAMTAQCLAAGFDAVLAKPLSVGAAIQQLRALKVNRSQ